EEMIWTEGESDVVVLRSMGAGNAYAITGGAKNPPSDEACRSLAKRGLRRVLLGFDADESGRAGLAIADERLNAAGIRTRTMPPPGYDPLTGDGKDWRDWHLAGGTTLPDPDHGLGALLTFDELAAEMPDLEWTYTGLLHEGGLTMLAGPPKAGKSTFY